MKNTIGCEEALPLLSRALDGELAGASKAALDAHVASCAACRTERDGLGKVDALVEDAFASAFDEALVRKIVRMAEARPRVAAPAAPRGQLLRFRSSSGLVAAAAASVLLAVGLAFREPGPVGGEAVVARAAIAKAYGVGVRVASRGGVEARIPAGPGAGIPVALDEVVVNTGGAASLVLLDGTRVDLRPDTAVSLRRESDGGTTVALSPNGGEVFCEVAKQAHPFRVAAGDLTATVLGTRFLLRSTSQESLVSVLEGRVRVASVNQQVIVSAEQEAFLERGGALVARPLAAPRARLAWNPRVVATLAEPTVAAPAPAPLAPGLPTSLPLGPVTSPAPADVPAPTPLEPGLDQPVTPPVQKKPADKSK